MNKIASMQVAATAVTIPIHMNNDLFLLESAPEDGLREVIEKLVGGVSGVVLEVAVGVEKRVSFELTNDVFAEGYEI